MGDLFTAPHLIFLGILAVLLFGSQIQSTLVLVVYASFWPVLIQVLYGVQDVDPVARETARSYGLLAHALHFVALQQIAGRRGQHHDR